MKRLVKIECALSFYFNRFCNEQHYVPANTKIEFISKLAETGLPVIEATAFVSPKWIPQMQDSSDVFSALQPHLNDSSHPTYPVLVPNLQGLQRALELGVKEVAVFTTVSETFCKKNVNCSIEESLLRIKEIIHLALDNGVKVRG